MKVRINSAKLVRNSIGLGLVFTMLSYFITLNYSLTGSFFPLFIHTFDFTSGSTGSSAILSLHGFPFAFIATNYQVTMFGTVAFLLDIIILSILSFILLYIILRTGNKKIVTHFVRK